MATAESRLAIMTAQVPNAPTSWGTIVTSSPKTIDSNSLGPVTRDVFRKSVEQYALHLLHAVFPQCFGVAGDSSIDQGKELAGNWTKPL